MPVLIEPPVRYWECGSCSQRHVTREVGPHTPFHVCRNGLTAPFVPEGERWKVTRNLREDYVGAEVVQTDDSGRPVMNVTVERPDGIDCSVFVPCATVSVGDFL